MKRNEVWLTVNANGVRPLEHEGGYTEGDTLLHVKASTLGDPVIRVVSTGAHS